MTDATTKIEATEIEAPKLRWSIRLYEDAPEKRYAVLGTAFIAATVGWMMFQSVIFPLIAIFAILGATTEFWLPISYVLDEKGGSARCGISVSAIEWSNVKRALINENWVKLSPLDSDTRLGEFRGVIFRYGNSKQEILDFVENKIGKECLIFGEKN